MKHVSSSIAVALVIAIASAARAGAPTPDVREDDFKHVCKGGDNKGQACTVANAAADCPKSDCVVTTLSKKIKGKLTIIAHDDVRDWANPPPGAGNQALTLMLEVKASDGTKQILAATYQDLTFPNNPPQALQDVINQDLSETTVQALGADVTGLMFAQPESVLAQRLQALFSSTGTPVIIAAKDKTTELADHTSDGLATVLRFKVIIQFLDPVI